MKELKERINMVYGIALLILSLFNFVIYKLDYVYRPKSYIIFIALYFIFVFSATVLSINYKKSVCRMSNIFAGFMPLIALLYAISLLHSFDYSIDFKTYSLIYYELMFAIVMAASLVVFFVHNSMKWLKILVGICTAGVGIIFAFIFFLSLIFTYFGESKILQTLNSSDGTYVAMVISHDGGAMGGDTCVDVRNAKKDIKLLIGNLNSLQKNIWIGEWNANPVLQWEDDNNLSINGTVYNVNYILDTNYKNNYNSKLKVFIPQRKPDYINDTHGGFHGDGTRVEKFILSAEEIQLIKQDIEKNRNWKELNTESKAVLYGGAEGYLTNGFLGGEIPIIENGYFSVFNKQNYNLEFPEQREYSYNCIIGIYSMDENILYIFEMDT